jgi:oxygen-dependent protoporphyrinogen oxidase
MATRMNNGSQQPVAVIGAGIAGLTAAHFLRRNGVPVMLLEGGKQVAGMASSYVDERGFHYDFGAHFITNRLAAAVGIGGQCRDVPYYGETFLVKGKQYSYPFGLLTTPRYVFGALKAKLSGGKGEPRTAADWFRREFGGTLADEVSLPILEAWSGAPADQLSAAVAQKLQNSIGRTVYLRLCSRLHRRAISIGYSQEMPEGPSVWHVYPERGVAQVCERLLADLRDVIELESPVEQIIVEGDRAVAVRAAGRERDVAAVVSTVPAPILPKLITGTDAFEPLRQFRYRPMVFVCLRFETRGILSDTVLWTAAAGFPFFRLTETPLSMPWLAPEGKTLITCDIGCQVGDEMWSMDDAALGDKCVEALESLYPNVRQHYSGCRVLRTPIAYPVYHLDYEEPRQRFAAGTGIDNLYSIGRNGEFAHILMEDVYWRTIKKMNELLHKLRGAKKPPHEPACAVQTKSEQLAGV